MKWCRCLLVGLMLAIPPASLHAGILFNRKPKANPAERVPQLVSALTTEADEHKRAAAAEELRNFDGNAYPEIVSALADAAMKDPQVSVRLEAVQSLAKVRPVTQRAGWALEQVLAKDPSTRVQWQARTALLQYRMSGYKSTGGAEPPPPARGIKTEEPPLAPPDNEASRVQGVATPARAIKVVPLNPAPPPAAPVVPVKEIPVLAPMPASAPALEKAPEALQSQAPLPAGDGPELVAPK
jgi:hypothetical protein